MNKYIIILLLGIHFITVPAEQLSRAQRRKSMLEKIEPKAIKAKMAALQKRNSDAKLLNFINCDIVNLT